MRPLPRSRPLAPAVTLAVALLLAFLPSGARAAGVTRESTTVDVSCAAFTYHQSADWYFPSGTPSGLIWLQHGFARANDHVRDLAEHYAAAGYLVFAPTLPSADLFGCTLPNLGNNKPFLDNVASWFTTKGTGADRLRASYARAAASAGRAGTALPSSLVLSGHSAGGEAVEYVAQRLHASAPADFARVRGLVLLDPVKSFLGSNTEDALTGLAGTGLPVHTISSPPYSCNSDATGTEAVQKLVPAAFVGVRLTTGAHTDAEGASTDLSGTALCGTPQTKNVAALQSLATAWASDAFTGRTTAAWYPGGASYDALLAAGTISTLAGAGV
ncbi:hypothetical protein ACLQ18_33000 [Streptomyces sp. DT193]|uniref:hypothetical protein n=1 Tax=Streptomyces sp. DT193 TaxID=3393418 RepID=UPI003CE86F2A